MNARLFLAAGKTVFFLLSLQLFSFISHAQSHYTGNTATLVVNGTSTLHDWSMKSAKADCSAQLNLGPNGVLAGIDNLIFTTPATGLKSEHSGMDNNAYKALKTDKNPNISFTLTSVQVTPAQGGASIARCTGKLTLAGVTKDIQLIATCKSNPDNTITVTGSQKISMQDYKIDPPTFMMGTIKTGNDVTITYTITLRKS